MSSTKQSRWASHASIRTALVAAALIGASGAAVAEVTKLRGGPIDSITILRGTDAVSTTSATFVDVPGAATKIKVGANTLVTARFSAESNCQGASASSYCSVQIVATKNGVATILRPDTGSDFAFDSGDNTEFWESHSMDRSIVLPSSGKYEIKAQYTSLATTASFRLDDWSLTIETAESKE